MRRYLIFSLGVIVGIITGLALIGFPAHAGLFDSMVTNNWDSVPSNKYLVEAHGLDIRTYDWKRTDGKICTMAFVDKGPVGLDCE